MIDPAEGFTVPVQLHQLCCVAAFKDVLRDKTAIVFSLGQRRVIDFQSTMLCHLQDNDLVNL